MIWMICGLALWWSAHLFKRVTPRPRARLGDPGKGLVAVLIVISIALMWWGYRPYEEPFWWGRTPALTGINNLLMLLAFYSYSSGATPPGRPRNRLGTKMRHPQLTGFALFCAAHLIPNGDLASFILFGGLLLWALVEIAVINRAEPEWTPPDWGGRKTEIRIAVIALVIYVIVALVHGWLGPWPFG